MTSTIGRLGAFALTFAGAATVAGALAFAGPLPAGAADNRAETEAVYKDIAATLGGVPAFVRQLPAAMLPGAWRLEKDLALSDTTALPPKVKALISLAVAAQIPCQYCIWADTNSARRAGATEEEIGEAVATAALTRQWSTVLNGLQVDFGQYRKDMGGDVPPVAIR